VSKKGVLYLFISLFFLSVSSLVAQNISKEKQPLTTILKILEIRYEIHFSYLDQTIKNKKTRLPNENLSVSEALKILESETRLDFIIIDDISIVISNNTTPFITEVLDEIVITNYLTTGISKSKSADITIKPEEFGILPGLTEPDVLQTILALPGVFSADESISNINIRGGTHDQNLMLWDGIKMYQSGHFFGLISAINPYLTKEVIVSKNGTSTKYGDGISGVIDMKQSNTIDNKSKYGVGFNLINGDGFAKIPLSHQTELQISARRSLTDVLITPTYDQYFKRVFQNTDLINNQNNTSITKNEHFYFYDVAVKFLYDISKTDKIRINFLNIYNNLNYDEQSTVNSVNEDFQSHLTQQNLATGLDYIKDWNSQFSTTAKVYLSKYNLNATNYDVTNNQRLIQENEVYDAGLKLNGAYQTDANLTLNFGYQFNEVGIGNLEDVNNPSFRSYVKEILRTHAIYGEAQFTSSDKNTFARVGLRTNYLEKFSEVYTEPRLAISHKFSNNFRLEVLAEFKSQTTSQIIDLQNDFLGVEKRRWILANNETVPVIESKQVSVGVHYNKNKLLVSLEAYIKDVNGITARSQGFQNQFQFVNDIGKYQVKGIDFLINKQFSVISTWLSYSFSKNDYTFENLNSGYAFPNNVDTRHALTFAGTYQLNNIKLALGLNWHSGKPTTSHSLNQNTENNSIEFTSPNSSNFNDYLRTDFSATYRFKMGTSTHAIIGASIWNVTNKKNTINTYYSIDDDDTINTVKNQSLGITPNVSFRVNF
jgi:hypothetical protein